MFGLFHYTSTKTEQVEDETINLLRRKQQRMKRMRKGPVERGAMMR